MNRRSHPQRLEEHNGSTNEERSISADDIDLTNGSAALFLALPFFAAGCPAAASFAAVVGREAAFPFAGASAAALPFLALTPFAAAAPASASACRSKSACKAQTGHERRSADSQGKTKLSIVHDISLQVPDMPLDGLFLRSYSG